MIPYVGDISKADAELLRLLAESSTRIVEFGSGASTQVLAAYGRGTVLSVDTEPKWIERTRSNLYLLNLSAEFASYEDFMHLPAPAAMDLVFVDGLNELRLSFALHCWPALRVGGALCFHDTRRTEPYGKAELSDVQMVCAMIENNSREIDSVMLNQSGSNITVLRKCEPVLLEDWAKLEGRTPAQLGLA
jgi:predicted O-methyltransferase YrrM